MPPTVVDRFGAALGAQGLRFTVASTEGIERAPGARFRIEPTDWAAALQILRSLPSTTIVGVREQPDGVATVVADGNGDIASLTLAGRTSDGGQAVLARFRSAARSAFAGDERVVVVLLGPDGVGKSSVLQQAGERLRGVAPAVRTVHLRPRFLPRRGRSDEGPVRDPHGRAPKPGVSSHLQLSYWWLEYWLDRVGTVVRRTHELRLCDRYVDDLLVDPRRYRYGGSRRFATWVVASVPRPDLVVLLDAPSDLVQRRKQEVAAAETERQRGAYLAYVRALANGRVVDASRPLDEVAADVVRLVVDLLARRAAARLEALRA